VSELSRLVWRHGAGYLLREQLGDHFLEELQMLRERMSGLHPDTGSTAAGARMAREFDDHTRAAERDARSYRFQNALKEIRRAETILEFAQELSAAHAAIGKAATALAELESDLAGATFPSIADFHILITRAADFMAREQFRVARFIAEEAVRGIGRLTAAAPEGEQPPRHVSQALERVERLAVTLAALDAGAMEQKSIRCAAGVLRTCLAARRFVLAAVLLDDIDSENAAVELFLAQKSVAERCGATEALQEAVALARNGDAQRWRAAAALLIDSSLKSASQRIAGKATSATGCQ